MYTIKKLPNTGRQRDNRKIKCCFLSFLKKQQYNLNIQMASGVMFMQTN